jgi:hypothetical protein
MAGGAEDDLYTYDLSSGDGGPRRPDILDLGGAEIADGSPAPTKGDQWYGGQANEHGRNLAGLNRLTPSCRIFVEYTGVAFDVTSVDAMGTLVVAADFTPTSSVTGTCNISWPANTLPPMQREPHAWLTGSFGSAYAAIVSANQIQVRLRDTAALANLSFAVEIL